LIIIATYLLLVFSVSQPKKKKKSNVKRFEEPESEPEPEPTPSSSGPVKEMRGLGYHPLKDIWEDTVQSIVWELMDRLSIQWHLIHPCRLGVEYDEEGEYHHSSTWPPVLLIYVEVKRLKALREARPGFEEELAEGWKEIKKKFEIDKDEDEHEMVCVIQQCRPWPSYRA
jgi:hypothetical protein